EANLMYVFFQRSPLMAGLVLAAPLAAAQLSGTVSSASEPVPGATVTASLGDQKVSTTTDDSGKYTLDGLGRGVWTVEVQMFDFAVQRGWLLIEDRPLTADWTLKLEPMPAAAPTNGFQTPGVSHHAENQVLAVLGEHPDEEAPDASDTTEALLLTGSVSRGLSAPLEQDIFARRRAEPTPQFGADQSGEDAGGSLAVGPEGAASGAAGAGGPPSGGLGSGKRSAGFSKGGSAEGGRVKKKKSKKRSKGSDVT